MKTFRLETSDLILEICPDGKRLWAKLFSKDCGILWVDGPVYYSLTTQDGEVMSRVTLSGVAVAAESHEKIRITGQLGSLSIEHTFVVDAGHLKESMTVSNSSETSVKIKSFAVGLTFPLSEGTGGVSADARDSRWVPIPCRRHPLGKEGRYEDFTAQRLLGEKPDYLFQNFAPAAYFPAESWIADGWVFTRKGQSLVWLKHIKEHCEFSTLSCETIDQRPYTRIAGFSLVEAGTMVGDNIRQSRQTFPMPGALSHMTPGARVRLGENHYFLTQGDWQRGYEVFRQYFEGCGYVPLKDFDPPLHWNQLYDMTSWHTVNTWFKGPRKELYTLDALWEEARKAQDYHCESLYLDPGWDTHFASSVWDEKRLGSQKDFVAKLLRDYGLKLALHVPLAMWCDSDAYPVEAHRMTESGERLHSDGNICSGAKQWFELKRDRLLKLCRDGASFLMFDGTMFTGECFDPAHGHQVPLTTDDQAASYQALVEAVHKEFPDVLIELHDVFAGGASDAVLPKYFPHKPGANVENWGNEYMWHTYQDLMKGGMKYLDYVNRAYSVPMYLHIALQGDNLHGLGFWYAASTCRHLGIGGTHANAAVVQAQKGHAAKYRQLKRFFTQGRYFALREDVHIHYLPDVDEMVVLVFNFSEKPVLLAETLALPPELTPSGSLIGAGGVGCSSTHLSIHLAIQAHGVEVHYLPQRTKVTRTSMIW